MQWHELQHGSSQFQESPQPAKHRLVCMGWPSYQMSAILKIESPWPVGKLTPMVAYMRRLPFHRARPEGCIFI
jgi:hypothetical protein